MKQDKTRIQPQRLNRIIAAAGLTSRRKADQWIKSGRVTVNNNLVTKPGICASWDRDLIKVDGERIPEPSSKLYLMLNKPFGYITSLNDPKGRPIITDLLKDVPQRVFPVGRLDFDSLGLLLITNDGDWAHHLMHPRYSIPRTYKVTVSGKIVPDAITALKRGVLLEDGPSGRSKVTLISCNQRQSLLRMTIYQGKSRQIRRMMEAVGYRVVHLIRIGFGNLTLGNLKIGEYRHLEAGEIESVASV